MRKIIFTMFAGFLCTQGCLAQTVIKNTNVLDVENRKMLTDYDVVTEGGKIIVLAKAGTAKYGAAFRVIDGAGKYLIPGFTDAHVHFFQSGSMFARPDAIDLRKYKSYADEIKYSHSTMEDFLRRYTAAGITSVIDVGSTYNFLDQRETFRNQPFAPEVYMTGALLTTYIPAPFKDLGKDAPFIEMQTEEGVRQSVRDLKAGKADFIKIWYIVLDPDKEKGARKNLPLVQAVIDEAHKNNMRVAVHATERITARLAVEAGADYLVHNIGDEVVQDDFLQLLKKHNIVLCPTMVVEGDYDKSLGHTYHFSADELSIVNPFTAATVIDFPAPDTALGNRIIKAEAGAKAIAGGAHDDSILNVNLKKLHDAGITIATGTDAGNIGTQHAGSFFNELKAMQDAGLTNWDLLVSSTINGAKALGKENMTGSIAKGKTADMILLNANPLDGLANWRKINYVINRGVAMVPDSILRNTPEMLVQQQLNGYNIHDMDAFLAPYSEDVKVFDLGGQLTINGKEDMRKKYTRALVTPGLYCRVVNRIVQDNTVVDHEEIHATGLDKPVYGIVFYVIEKGKIAKVYMKQ